MTDAISIILNGEEKLVHARTIASLKQELGIGERKVAMEKNRVVIRHSEYDMTEVAEGDEIEVVEFIGGG